MVDRTLSRRQAQEKYLRDTPEGRRMMSGLGAVGRPGALGAPISSPMGVPNVTLTPNELVAYTVSPFARERAGLLGVRRGLFDIEGPEMVEGIPPGQLDLEMEREKAIAAVPPQGLEPSELRQSMLGRRSVAARTPDIFALEGPEMGTEIANILAEVTRRPGGGRPGAVGMPGVGGGFAPSVPRDKEPPAAEAEPEAEPEAPAFDPQTAFMDAIDAAMEAAGKDLPEVRDIDAYKKEFAEATGIDIGGKPDKSAALMAFGLALMQNRAGSGFNVGNMLRSIGEAGEKAMPALEAAKKEARASALAAGKYALEQIQAGKSAEAAFAKEVRDRNFEWLMQERKIQAEAEKAQQEGVEYKNVSDREIMPEVKVAYGNVNGNTVLAKPSADANVVTNAWNKYSRGEEVTNEMMGLLEDMSQSGAPALSLLYNRAVSVLSSLGVARPEISMGAEGATPEQKFNAFKLSVINEMKKIILQESQVSDYDRKTLEASFGLLELATTPEASMFALQQMISFFESRKASLNGVLQHLYDPSFYSSTKEYDRTISFLNDNLKIPYVFAPETNGPAPAAGSPVATVDLTNRGER